METAQCNVCEIKNNCCAVKDKNKCVISIENSGNKYRICKVDLFNERLEYFYRQEEKQIEKGKRYIEERNKKRPALLAKIREKKEAAISNNAQRIINETSNANNKPNIQKSFSDIIQTEESINPENRTCFLCKNNLEWANKNGMANCGMYERLRLPKSHDPYHAKVCKSFHQK